MNNSPKKKVLIFIDWFFPGYKAGGPIQSCKNIVTLLKQDFDFYIFTSDRDLGDTKSYNTITADEWNIIENGLMVFYASPLFPTVKNIKHTIEDIKPAVIYLNSMFSSLFTIKPLIALKNNKENIKVILAPRGMLHSGAIRAKKLKKIIFLKGLRFTGLTNKIYFHATDQTEVSDIKKKFPEKWPVKLVENIPNSNPQKIKYVPKKEGAISFVFISRIHPKKNLLFFIKLLSAIKNYTISLHIYGYIDDEIYFQKIGAVIKKMRPGISVVFHGSLPNSEVFETISNYHVFVLPTLGENFGHAIFEALSAGRPVLISDQTPWRNLIPEKAGWDINLSKPEDFVTVIEQAALWKQDEFDDWCNSAYRYAQKIANKTSLKQDYIDLFT